MTITVNYEECEGCEEAPTCELLRVMRALVDATAETLREMTGSTSTQHEVHN